MGLTVDSERRRIWRMLLQLQKHLQTELRPFKVRSHMTQKLGQISKICSIQKLDIVP